MGHRWIMCDRLGFSYNKIKPFGWIREALEVEPVGAWSARVPQGGGWVLWRPPDGFCEWNRVFTRFFTHIPIWEFGTFHEHKWYEFGNPTYKFISRAVSLGFPSLSNK